MANKTTERDLMKAYWDNVREHQIGGETDGVSAEVAEDLGFTVTPEQMKDIINRLHKPIGEAGVAAATDISERESLTWSQRRRIAKKQGIAPEEVGLTPEERRDLR